MKVKTELMNLKVKEEYLDLVPRLSKEERISLKEDIMLNGQHDPIVINRKGIILDGHTRHEICQELGKQTKYRIQDFKDEYEEKRYVISCNVNRRQLTQYGKVELSYKLFMMEKEYRKYAGRRVGSKLGRASEMIGKSIGVGRNGVQRSVYIIEHGNDEVKDKLRRGAISLEKAYAEIKKADYLRPNNRNTYITMETKLICPHCQQISKRRDWKKA